jgi:hypothetical protein
MRRRVKFSGLLIGAAMLATALASSASMAEDLFPDDPNLFWPKELLVSGRVISTSIEFDWSHNPSASKEEVCTVYANNAQNLAQANERQACGFDWGSPSDEYTNNYNLCMNNLSVEDAMLGPQNMAHQMGYCSACVNEQERLTKAIQKAEQWGCFSSGGFQSAGISANDPSWGALSSDPNAVQQCIKDEFRWGASPYFNNAERFIIATLWCGVAKFAGLPQFFSEIAPPWLGTLLDPQGERAPPPPRGWVDQPCGDRLHPCYSPSRRAAIALATSNSNLRQSLLWRFRNLPQVDAPTVTPAALTTPSPEIKKTDRTTRKKLKNVNRREIEPSVPPRTIPSGGLLETTPGLSPQGPAAVGAPSRPIGTPRNY